MLALQVLEADTGSHGIPLSEATDSANEFGFEASPVPVVDHAARTLEHAKTAYYKQYDTKENPVDRAGHLWSVHRK